MTIRNIPETYSTIATALSACSNGDTVSINSGTSFTNEVLHSFGALSGITISNNTGGNVAVGVNTSSYILAGTSWTIESPNGTITFTGGTSGAPLLYVYNKSGVYVSGCIFSRPSGGIPIKVSGVSANSSLALTNVESYASAATNCLEVYGNGRISFAVINNCHFEGGSSGVDIYAGTGRGGDTEIYRSTFKNTETGIIFNGAQTGGLIARFNIMYGGTFGFNYDPDVGYAPDVLFSRNTIDVSDEAILATAIHSNSNARIKGNWGAVMEIPLDSDWDYNGYVSKTGVAGGNDMITLLDPGFTNKAGNDYTLLSNSSLVDNGFDTGSETDFAGDPTPSGGQADIGAYEFQVVAWTYPEEEEPEQPMTTDFTIQNAKNMSANYNKAIPLLPFGYYTNTLQRLHGRSAPYKVTK